MLPLKQLLVPVLVLNVIGYVYNCDLEVKFSDGVVRGIPGKDLYGNGYCSFRGIPYAQPPVGMLRFKDPVPAKKWHGILNANKYRAVCPQGAEESEQSEDCLHLNVYVSNITSSARSKAVMFYIYGGGFVAGSSTDYQLGPENLLTGDIVLITINYRLGMLGYAFFDDPSLNIFGNQGMKDQVLALEWVQKNIAAFGGDPKRVTILGNSDGANSAHLHMMSPLSRGLFQRVILQSGTMIYDAIRGVSARQVASLLNEKRTDKLPLRNDRDAFAILNATDGQNLYWALTNISSNGYNIVGPIVEDAQSPNPFLPRAPLELMASGEFEDVPLIIGYNNEEGLMKFPAVVQQLKENIEPDLFATNNEHYSYIFGVDNFDAKHADKLMEPVKKFYNLTMWNSSRDSEEDLNQLARNWLHLDMDINFFLPIYDTIVLQLPKMKSNAYVYRFCMNTQLNYLKRRLNLLDLNGAVHADELGYLFKQKSYPTIIKYTPEDIGIKIMVTYWTNFAKTGNPNVPDSEVSTKWPTFDNKGLKHINLDLILTTSDVIPEQQRMNFWGDMRSGKYAPNAKHSKFGKGMYAPKRNLRFMDQASALVARWSIYAVSLQVLMLAVVVFFLVILASYSKRVNWNRLRGNREYARID